jgi:hypothetical protein
VEEDDLFIAGNDDDLGDMMGFEGQKVEELHEAFDAQAPVHELANLMAESKKELATIPEVDTPSHKSKRRAESVNEHSLERVERIKAACNLDFTSEKGNSSKPHASFIHYSNENVIDNLKGVGISLGNNLI